MKQSFLPAKIEVVQKDGKEPLSYCYHCRHLMKEGDIIETISIRFFHKKLRRYAERVHQAHERCVRRREEL